MSNQFRAIAPSSHSRNLAHSASGGAHSTGRAGSAGIHTAAGRAISGTGHSHTSTISDNQREFEEMILVPKRYVEYCRNLRQQNGHYEQRNDAMAGIIHGQAAQLQGLTASLNAHSCEINYLAQRLDEQTTRIQSLTGDVRERDATITSLRSSRARERRQLKIDRRAGGGRSENQSEGGGGSSRQVARNAESRHPGSNAVRSAEDVDNSTDDTDATSDAPLE